MSEIVNLPALKVTYLTATPEKQILVYNRTTGATISYGVTSAVGDGTLTAGQSVQSSDALYVRSDINASVILTYKAGSTTEDVTITDDLSVAGTTAFTGAITTTGGVTPTSAPKFITTVPIGSVAYGSFGTDTATADNKTVYLINVFVPCNTTLTGGAKLNGTAHTDKLCYYLFNNAGTKVAQTAAAGTASATNDVFQEIAFTATYAAVGPANYWLGVQANGATAKSRLVAASTAKLLAGEVAGTSFGAETSVVPPTTFTANTGPIGYLY
jgi:hypothetical protein